MHGHGEKAATELGMVPHMDDVVNTFTDQVFLQTPKKGLVKTSYQLNEIKQQL